MYERRRQAASLVSLLVVTLLFVWACSSGGHEDASVTTGGGAGLDVAAASAAGSFAEGGSPFEAGGPSEFGAAPSTGGSGSGSNSGTTDPDPSGGTGSLPANGSSGANADGDEPVMHGGSAGTGGTDADGGFAGKASAGAPAVEPICDPADTSATDGLVLPCNVSSVLYVCRNCHSNPPQKPAVHSYVTYEEVKAAAPRIYGVVKSGFMPWPPYKLSASQAATLLKWLGKDGTCAIGAEKACQ